MFKFKRFNFFLKNKHLGGAGLDVVEGEPLKQNHTLLKFDNVVVTTIQEVFLITFILEI